MKRNILVFVFMAFVMMSLCSCKEKTQTVTTVENKSTTTQKEKTKPETPFVTLNDDFTISWDKVSGTSYYVININGVDNSIKETNNSYKIIMEPGAYSIKVKSVNSVGESEYSNVIEYSVSNIELKNETGSYINGKNIHISGTTYKLNYSLPFDEYDYSDSFVVIKDNNGNEKERIKLENASGELSIDSINSDSIIMVEGIKPKTFKLNYLESDLYTITGGEVIQYNGSCEFKVNVDECASNSTPIVEIDGKVSTPNESGYYSLKNIKHNPLISISGLKKNIYTISYVECDSLYRVNTQKDINHGESYTILVEVDERYVKSNTFVSVNGINVGNVNTEITIDEATKNQLISVVNLDANEYVISYSKGTGYETEGIAKAYEGTKVGVILNLDDAYNRSNAVVMANGTALTKENGLYYIDAINENVSITVSGIEKNKYTVSTDENPNFTYEYSKNVSHGGTIMVGIETTGNYSRIDLLAGGKVYTSDDGVFLIQNVTDDIVLKAIGYTPKEEFLLESAYVSDVTIDENKVVSNDGNIEVNADLIFTAIDFGFDSLKMNVESSTGYFVAKSNGNVVRLLSNNDMLRVNLDWIKHGFIIEPVNKQGVKQNGDIIISNIDVFDGKQSIFTKTNSMVYVAYEDESVVMDSKGINETSYAYIGSLPFEPLTLSNVIVEDENGNAIFVSATNASIDKNTVENHIVLIKTDNGYNLEFVKLNSDSINLPIKINTLSEFVTLKVKGINTVLNVKFSDESDYSLSYNGIDNSYCGIDLETIRPSKTLNIELNGSLSNKTVELNLLEKNTINKFYSIAAWGDLNGGNIMIYDDYMIVKDSWQLNMVDAWLNSLKALGYKKIEFDISVSGNSKYIQCYQTGEYLSNEPYTKVTYKMGTSSIIWLRGKTELGTKYGDETTIHSGDFMISNFKAYDTLDLNEEFYDSSSWSNLNGGSFGSNGNTAIIKNSWQVELSKSYLDQVINAGYKAIEFDIKIDSDNITAIQLESGRYLDIENGCAHLRWVADNGTLVFRGKTKAEGGYQENADSASFTISNVTFDTELREDEENIFKNLFSNLNGGVASYGENSTKISGSWQINISKEYCKSLLIEGYKKISFDIELVDPNLYLALKYNNTQTVMEKTIDGKYHLEIDLSILESSEYFIRCKTSNTTGFDDSQTILSFTLTINNAVLA